MIDRGRFAPTERGSPQGGVISPVLMNVALHGMEEAAGVRYIPSGSNAGTARPGSPVLVRYADDLLALCHSREQAEQVKARLAAWLAPRGLAFNEDKTRIVHLDDGVDFLGFNVRRYRGKLLIKPSKAAVKRIRARLTAEMRALRGHNAQMVLIRLNPDHPGLVGLLPALRVRPGVQRAGPPRVEARLQVGEILPSAQGEALDHRPVLRRVQLGQARPVGVRRPRQRRLPAQVRLDEDHPAHAGQGLGVPGRPGPGRLLGGPAATRDTPAATGPGCGCCEGSAGACPLCGDLLLHADQEPQHPDEWEQWITAVRKAVRHQAITLDAGPGTPDRATVFRLIHTHCRRRLPDGTDGGPALLQS